MQTRYTCHRFRQLAGLLIAAVFATPAFAQVEFIINNVNPTTFVVDNDRLYYTGPGSEFCSLQAVWTLPPSGGTPELLDPNSGGNGCELLQANIVSSGAHIYLAASPNVTRFYSLGGEPTEVVAPSAVNATNIAADAKHLFIGMSSGAIRSHPRAGGGQIASFNDTGTLPDSFVAPGDGFVYYISSGDIFRWDGTSGAPSALETSSVTAKQLWVEGTSVYWLGTSGGQDTLNAMPTTGGTSGVIYSPEFGATLSHLTMDADNYYFVALPSAFVSREIRRLPRFGGPFVSTADVTDVGQITPVRLQQDDQYLYWVEGGDIRRIDKDATAPLPDLSWGRPTIEVVQAVQDGNNAVQLISGIPTIARAYAQVTGRSLFRAQSRLEGTRLDGSALPGSPLRSTKPWVYNLDTTPADRAELNQSFNFVIPASWIGDTSSIRLRAILDPDDVVEEANEGNNATSNQTFDFDRKDTVVFDCRRVRTQSPRYDTSAANFSSIIERAKSILPVSKVIIRPINGELQEWEPTFFNPFRRGPWELNGEVCLLGFTACIDEDDWVLGRLWLEWLASEIPELPADAFGSTIRHHRLGMVHPSATWSSGGLGTTTGHAMLVKMRGSPGYSDLDDPPGGTTLAHEFTHNMGFNHVNCGSGLSGRGEIDNNYPNPTCQIGPDRDDPDRVLGYDRLRNEIIETDADPYMSYGRDRWTTPYHWNGIANRIGTRGVSGPPSGDHVVVTLGVFDPITREPTVLEVRQLDRSLVSAENLESAWLNQEALSGGSPLSMTLLDAFDTPITTVPVALRPECCAMHVDPRFFYAITPCDAPVAGAQIISETGDADSPILRSSASAPLVFITSPTAGESFTNAPAVTWNAFDADGDQLSATVQYSRDDGVTWEVVGSDVPGTRFEGDELLPGSESTAGLGSSLFRVIVTDGFNTASATSPNFVVSDRAPSVAFLSPAPGQVFEPGEQIRLEVLATDPEDLEVTSYEWFRTPAAFPFATSMEATATIVDGLPPGEHTFVVHAEDSQSQVGAAAVTFTVGELFIPPAPDGDGDGVPDEDDNCPDVSNTSQSDGDGDGYGDVCDNCPSTHNAQQVDADEDGIGDACDACVDGSLAGLGVDGRLDSGYGPPLAVQNTSTSRGDSVTGDVGGAMGSELDTLHAFIDCDRLYIFLGGNLKLVSGTGETDRLMLFIDTGPGGQNRLLSGSDLVPLNDDGSGNGLTFDATFDADYWVELSMAELDADPPEGISCAFGSLTTEGSSGFEFDLGDAAAFGDGTLSNVVFGAPELRVTIDNSNRDGVSAGSGTDDGAGVATGVELSIPLDVMGDPSCGLRVLAMVLSEDGSVVSNQLLPGIGGGGELGDPRELDLGTVPGAQYASVGSSDVSAPAASPAAIGGTFTVGVSVYAQAPYTVQWRRNDVALADDQRVSGATQGVLTISPVQAQDAGVYDVVVTSSCGTTQSGSVALDLETCQCEFDGDPVQVNTLDLLAYLAVWFASGAAADLDASGVVDIIDLLQFLSCWFAATDGVACP